MLPPTGLSAQSADTLPAGSRIAPLFSIGTAAEDQARLQHLFGASADGFLLRSPSSQGPDLPADGELRWSVIAPEVAFAWNSELPFSLNDGALWAGRGTNALVTGGARLRRGRISLILAPQLVYSENQPFQTASSDPADPRPEIGRSIFASPWYVEQFSADLPIRFGDRSLLELRPGQSTLMVDAGPVEVGAATENQWWGPGIRNAILLSNQAEGIPHLFVRTTAPLRTPLGSVEARWILGGLSESLFFDAESTNDVRALSGFAATFRPSIQPDLTLGVGRVVYSATEGAGEVPLHFADVFTEWGRSSPPAADSLSPAGSAAATQADHEQIFSLFARWIFPANGLELYAEWARLEFPSSIADLLNEPNHTQGYTLGLQWARPVRENTLFRIQSELTYLEESTTFNNRPSPLYYVSPSVVQGYTHRGQVVGAAVGPGGSSQWLALDYLPRTWRIGLFGGRIRWNNDVYYSKPGRQYVAHDVSVFGGIRAGWRFRGAFLQAEYATEVRYNYLFQNPEFEPDGRLAVDVRNHSLRFTLAPAWPAR